MSHYRVVHFAQIYKFLHYKNSPSKIEWVPFRVGVYEEGHTENHILDSGI